MPVLMDNFGLFLKNTLYQNSFINGSVSEKSEKNSFVFRKTLANAIRLDFFLSYLTCVSII